MNSKQLYVLDRKDLGPERAENLDTLFKEYEAIRNGVSDNLRKIGFAALYVTANCHLDCIHCYTEEVFGTAGKDISTEQIIGIINFLGTITERIQLTGGEVMMRKDPGSGRNDALLLVDEIQRRKMEPIFQTTGMQLDEQLIAYLAEHGVKWVSLSLDGPDEATNSLIRKNPRAFTKVMEILPLLKKHGIKIKIGTVITKLNANVEKLIELGKLLADHDIDNWKLMQFFPRERGRNSGSNEGLLSITDAEFRELISPVIKEFSKSIRRVTSHNVDNYSHSPALLVQPTGAVTVTSGKKDVTLGNILEVSPEELIRRCEAHGIIGNIQENTIKTY